MRKMNDGVAGLFDALFFLAVASVVSVALLSVMNEQGGATDGGDQARVEAAHLVLLRTTLNDGANNTLTVEELCKCGMYRADVHQENVTAVLDLLLPGMNWSWTAVQAGGSYHLGSVHEDDGEVFCSVICTPGADSEEEFRLEAWQV